MIRICAWCEVVLDLEPPLDDPAVTYGVCPECWSRRRKPKSTVSADIEFLAASQARRWGSAGGRPDPVKEHEP